MAYILADEQHFVEQCGGACQFVDFLTSLLWTWWNSCHWIFNLSIRRISTDVRRTVRTHFLWIVIDTIIIIIVKGGNFYNYTHNVRPVIGIVASIPILIDVEIWVKPCFQRFYPDFATTTPLRWVSVRRLCRDRTMVGLSLMTDLIWSNDWSLALPSSGFRLWFSTKKRLRLHEKMSGEKS